MKKTWIVAIWSVYMLVLTTGCNTVFVGNLEEERIKLKKDSANELEVELNLGAGQLDVTGGADMWMEGELNYNHDTLKPNVSYKLVGETGKISIEQSENTFKHIKNVKTEWDIQLSNEVPIDLTVNAGASQTNLKLQGIQLKNLDIDAGVGDLRVDLSGKWNESFSVNLNAGVGKSTIILPPDVGVKITTSNGIGKANFVGFISKGDGVYVNDAYEHSDILITVQSEMGVGKITCRSGE